MSENIKERIDKIESDMRYLRYLQNSSKKADGNKPGYRPEKRCRADLPYAKPQPGKLKPLANFIRVSKPPFVIGGQTPECRSDIPAFVETPCDPLCKAPCTENQRRPPPTYVEPPFVQTICRPQGAGYARKPAPTYDTQCIKACHAPCSENSRRPAAIYKDPTLPTKRIPLVDNCTPRRLEYDTLCVPECGQFSDDSKRRVSPVYDDSRCLPSCKMDCNELMHCSPTASEMKRDNKTGLSSSKGKGHSPSELSAASHSKSGHLTNKILSEAELYAADKKMRELEDRLNESNEKQREADAQRAASDEKVRMLEEQLREAEKVITQSEEQIRTLKSSVDELESTVGALQLENDKMQGSLELRRAASRRNSEEKAMALDLASKLADKYKAASVERMEALNQVEDLKAENEALMQQLKEAEERAAALEEEAQRAHEQECQELLQKQKEFEELQQSLLVMEERAKDCDPDQIEDLKREAASSMRRAAEAEARAEEERARAEEAAKRAKDLEEESRIADERANEAENDAREARQRAKDAEQRAEDLEAASDDQKKHSRDKSPAIAKRKCKCRSRSRKREKERKEVVEAPVQVKQVDYRTLQRHKCCLCCCRKYEIQKPREYPVTYRVDIR